MPAVLHVFLEALGENLRSRGCPHSWARVSFNIYTTCSGQIFLTSHHSDTDSSACLHWSTLVIALDPLQCDWLRVGPFQGVEIWAPPNCLHPPPWEVSPLFCTSIWSPSPSAQPKTQKSILHEQGLLGILLQKTWRIQPSRLPPLISHPSLFCISLGLSSQKAPNEDAFLQVP